MNVAEHFPPQLRRACSRASAIPELRWNQVDLEAGRIRFGAGKGNKHRPTAPINDRVRPALEEARRGRTTGRVIEHGGQAVASVHTGLTAACRRANLPGVTAHVLRHKAARWMVQSGVPLYGHHAPDWLNEAARALAG